MKRQLLILFLSFLSTGCISVSLKPATSTPLKNLSYQPPVNYLAMADIELSYQNPTTGDIIFVESVCPSDQEQFVIELTQSLKSSRMIEKSVLKINTHSVQRWHYSGQKQSQPFNLFITHWEINNCAVYVTLISQQEEVIEVPADFMSSLNSVRIVP